MIIGTGATTGLICRDASTVDFRGIGKGGGGGKLLGRVSCGVDYVN